MTRKFKVGDRVKCVNNGGYSRDIVGKYGRVLEYNAGRYVHVEFEKFIDGHSCSGRCKYGYGWNCEEDMLELADKKETIVIYRKDDEVIALDKVSGKTGVAKCGRKDTFDFATGARIAFERLLGDPKPEEPKYFTGKAVCTFSFAPGLTEGKVYVITNGVGYNDNGKGLTRIPVRSVDELNSRLRSQFLEIKEDPKPEEPEKTPLNVKIVFTKGDDTFKTGHVYEVKDGKIKSPVTGKLYPQYPEYGFTKFYSVEELEDYFKSSENRKLVANGWSFFNTLEFIVIEED